VTEIDSLDAGLQSLRSQLGDDSAIDAYLERWPEAGPELAAAHVGMIHCHATLAEARKHVAMLGGRIVAINASGLRVRIDRAEEGHPHPVVRETISASLLRWVD
jgi:hypothetical protein